MSHFISKFYWANIGGRFMGLFVEASMFQDWLDVT